ncbi:MAG: hypothetical protein K0R52_64 [Alphaproteobacteria bacterium]|jgi:hypothetical protein|nr:hypothetical protein [Alphaproteobacteria bacterium]
MVLKGIDKRFVQELEILISWPRSVSLKKRKLLQKIFEN